MNSRVLTRLTLRAASTACCSSLRTAKPSMMFFSTILPPVDWSIASMRIVLKPKMRCSSVREIVMSTMRNSLTVSKL